jgi:hypothetical protein
MGSSPNPSPAHPTRELEAAHGHQAREQRITGAQGTTRGPEQAFGRLNPEFGVPADPHNPYGRQAMQDREGPWPWAAGSPSRPAARTTPTR